MWCIYCSIVLHYNFAHNHFTKKWSIVSLKFNISIVITLIDCSNKRRTSTSITLPIFFTFSFIFPHSSFNTLHLALIPFENYCILIIYLSLLQLIILFLYAFFFFKSKINKCLLILLSLHTFIHSYVFIDIDIRPEDYHCHQIIPA